MRALQLAAATVLISMWPTVAEACADDEATLFSCLTEDQSHVIQLCAVRDDAAGGYQSLQYRYGTEEADELVYPESRRDGRHLMSFAHAFDKDTYVWSLRFENTGYVYRVFGLGEDAGIEVWRKKKRLARVICGERPYAYPADIRRAASCDMSNPFGAAGCADDAPTRK